MTSGLPAIVAMNVLVFGPELGTPLYNYSLGLLAAPAALLSNLTAGLVMAMMTRCMR